MMPLENPTLYLLMKMSSASAPSETLHFPLQKPSPFSVSPMSGLWKESLTHRVKVMHESRMHHLGWNYSLPALALDLSHLQAWLQQHGCEFLVQTWSKILLSQIQHN